MTAPEIATYRLDSGPCAAEWIALVVIAAVTSDGREKYSRHPNAPLFLGHSKELANGLAEGWLETRAAFRADQGEPK